MNFRGAAIYGQTYIEQTGASAHDEARLIESLDAGGAISGLAIRQMRSCVGEVHPGGQIRVVGCKFKRRNLKDMYQSS